MDEEVVGDVGPEDGYLLVRIHVPELNVQKCLQFPRDQLVWDVKQQCLAALPKVATWFRDLKESFNYGLFCPAQNGRAGKFLDEERRLGDYPFSGPVGYLELKYKRRVYKTLGLEEKQLRALHTRANLRRLLDYVTNGQVEKIAKMCSKGIDPNFHCPDTGETPLTLATGTKAPAKTLIALVNGGAILDYRTKDGATALHRATTHNCPEAVRTLLELGASPNYRDGKGLTPLYLSVSSKIDPSLTELLLHDHASIGAQDLQGWREAHQACRAGLVQHLEHLLYYGADMNVRNASGNTPLHVCAVNNQESCARLLLFRGCDKEALNYANQTPYQVAVIAGNLDLAEMINQHRGDDVVPFREAPTLRRGRRMNRSDGRGRGTSPTLSLQSMCPYSSACSSLSETSSSSGASNSASYLSHITDKSLGDTSDVISESSGVGTGSDTNTSIAPGSVVVCVEDYRPCVPGHLRITNGEIVEITGASEDGLLEGKTRHQGSGLFPSCCVEEVALRTLDLQDRVQGRREVQTHFATAPRLKKTIASEPHTVVLHRARKGFGFVLRGAKAASPLMELRPSEKCPGLQYLDDVDAGGVADRAGLRKGDYLLAINGEDVSAASHERVVDLIRRSGELVQMTVVSVGPVSLPGSQSTSSVATLPRPATLGRRAPLPPRRDPNTTLTASAAAAMAPRTASIRARPVSSRITAAELEELFQRQRGEPAGLMASSTFVAAGSVPGSGPGSPKVYASVAEMKRSKSKGLHKVRLFGSKKKSNMAEMHREFHSSPDLAGLEAELAAAKPHRSQEDIGTVLRPLPPSHPPPPPPTSQVIKVETRSQGPRGGILVSKGEVVSARAGTDVEPEVMSSFRPCDNAKLYAKPDELKTVGFRARIPVRKAHSLRSPPRAASLTGDEDPRHPAHGSQTSQGNPYAQPFRTTSRSNSTVSDSSGRPPPIPDPDYSLSESEGEEGEVPAGKVCGGSQESSGNSHSSGSTGAVPHSFSVQEIQKVRTKLKSSRSYPNDFAATKEEDGDNSSSGVSSDQDVAVDDNTQNFHRQNSIRISNKQKAMQMVNSLALLPPPLEEESAEASVVPPPAEFTELEVLAPPPPQFSDGRLVTRVRVVGGALPHHPPY